MVRAAGIRAFAIVADGPLEVTKLARLCVREGVDSIKLNISGADFTSRGAPPRTVMSEDEIRAGVTVARDFGRMVNAHCRAAESVKSAVRCGPAMFLAASGRPTPPHRHDIVGAGEP